MYKLTIGNKEYQIKYGYEATVRSRIISRITGMIADNKAFMKNIEDILVILPELLLVGLQYNHRDEFGYDYATENGKEEAISKVYALLEQFDDADVDKSVFDLYADLQEEMLNNGFLAKLFQEEKAKKNSKKSTLKVVN